MSDSNLASECTNVGCQIDEEDIGGFAGIAGCSGSLNSHEKQVSEVQNIQIHGSKSPSFAQTLFYKGWDSQGRGFS